MYDGTKFVLGTNNIIKHSLRIMYYETLKHYQPILNLVAAAGSRGYCIPCNKIFSREESHKCSQKCSVFKNLLVTQGMLNRTVDFMVEIFSSIFVKKIIKNQSLLTKNFQSVRV